tara:strand:- start:240 stop:746 length:507 start_codon:yes stop_codon:yes gene_type:complete
MGSDKRTEYKRKYRAEARRLLKDSYIKRCLKQKFKASEITEKMIIECRKSIKKSRRRRDELEKLRTIGKCKCRTCHKIDCIGNFTQDKSKKYGHRQVCPQCESKRINGRQGAKEYTKKYNKKIKENLEDVYVRMVLSSGSILKRGDIPQELVGAKRQQLLIERITKES